MQIGLNVEEKDGSQAVRSEVVRIFTDEGIQSYVIPLGRVTCTPGEIEYTLFNFYYFRVCDFYFNHNGCD